jgi:ketol-acid reductoisomerase
MSRCWEATVRTKETFYSSAEVCKIVGISKNTLLRWEESKQVPEPHRDGRGWRLWSKADLNRIMDIKKSVERKKVHSPSDERLHIYVIGYGNQATAWAKNLKDSGAEVTVLLRKDSPAVRRANNDGIEVRKIEECISVKGIFCVLIPDDQHKNFFEDYKKHINPESVFIFAHGFSVGYEGIKISAKKVLLAPKAIANLLRSNYLDDKTTVAAISMEYADGVKLELIEKIAGMIGLSPLIDTTFFEETISDLFSEQVILCGGVPALMVKSFNIMVQRGINPKLAMQECLNELIYILEVIKEKGFAVLFRSISPIARRGGEMAWEYINSGKSVDELLEKHFNSVESKAFLNELGKESAIRDEISKNIKLFDKEIL